MFKSDALRALRPNAQYTAVEHADGSLELHWFDTESERPTDEEIAAAAVECENDFKRNTYQRDRQQEYPDLAVLADALYWSNQGDNTKLDEYYAACSAVKAKYPKP